MPAEVCPRPPLESRGRPAQSQIPGRPPSPVTGSDEKGLTLSLATGVSSQVLRAWLALVLVVCASCAHPPIKGRVAEPTPIKSLGRPGCGPPITYQVFRRDAFGADWAKTKNMIAFNHKAADGA